jgi:hypothetical protein
MWECKPHIFTIVRSVIQKGYCPTNDDFALSFFFFNDHRIPYESLLLFFCVNRLPWFQWWEALFPLEDVKSANVVGRVKLSPIS